MGTVLLVVELRQLAIVLLHKIQESSEEEMELHRATQLVEVALIQLFLAGSNG